MPAKKASDDPSHPASIHDHEIEIEHLYRHAPVGLAFLDSDLRYVRINQMLADINGKSIADHIGRRIREVVPKMAEKVEPLYRKVIESGEPILEQEVRGEVPSEPGTQKNWLVSYFPVKSAYGSVLGVNAVIRDITVQKKAEESLKNSEARFKAFMNHYPAHIYIKDQSLKHIFGNKTLLDSFELDLSSFINTTSDDFFSPDAAKIIEEEDLVILKEGGTKVIEHELLMLDGQLHNYWDLKFRISMGDGEFLIGGISIDITEFKKNEQRLKKALDEITELKKRVEHENIYLREEIELKRKHGEMVGNCKAVQKVLQQAEKVADTGTTVLISGETGTGKEILAQAIHKMSSRKDSPLVMVNCAALPATLIESELFGAEKGAYTGSMGKRVGRFEIADGSTLFLDEISEFPYELQAKLLRVLQDGQFERIGSSRTLQVDVRLIAATNKDLRNAVKEGTFRKDLYYRINVFPINMPPLRDRRDDIPQLVWFFVKTYSQKMGKAIDRIPRKTMDLLQSYYWPGNIRELKNVIERAMILSTGKELHIDLLETEEEESQEELSLETVEKNHILRVLKMTGWKIKGSMGAAEILGLKPPTLYSRMKKLRIKRNG